MGRLRPSRSETNLEQGRAGAARPRRPLEGGGRGGQGEGRGPLEAIQGGARRGQGEGRRLLRATRGRVRGAPQEEGGALRAGRGPPGLHRLAEARRRPAEAPGGVEADRAHRSRPGKGSLGALPQGLRPLLQAPRSRPQAAQGGVGRRTKSKKHALIERAEALAGSTDWDAALASIKKLQAEWKAMGPVKKSHSDALWQRFRAPATSFFERYKRRDQIALEKSQAEREALLASLEALAPAEASAAAPRGPGRSRGRDPGLVAPGRAAFARAGRDGRPISHGAASRRRRLPRRLHRAPTSIPRTRRRSSRSCACGSRPSSPRRLRPPGAWPSSSRTPSPRTPWGEAARPRPGAGRRPTRCARRARPMRGCLPSPVPKARPSASASRRRRAGRPAKGSGLESSQV